MIQILKILSTFAAAICCCSICAYGQSEAPKSLNESSQTQNAGENPKAQISLISPARAKLAAIRFEDSLKKIGAGGGAIVLVENGKCILAKTFPNVESEQAKSFPLGKSSSALVSLAAVAMAENSLFKLDDDLSRFCSYFRLSGGRKASMSNLLSGKISFDVSADELVPRDSQASDVFDIAAQIYTTSDSDMNKSAIANSCAAYSLGYIADKGEKNFKKSFVRAMGKYVFEPLKMGGVKYRNFNDPFFGALPIALTAEDAAKWLECETSPRYKIAPPEDVAKRRLPVDEGGKFGLGWLSSSRSKTDFQMCGDFFQNCANIVAVFPDKGIAAAFFVRSSDPKSAPKACAAALEYLVEMLENPPSQAAK